jgi:hypothetical protein
MNDKGFQLYGYRWVVLGVFMFINVTIQMLWITYAPITGPAAQFYGVDDLQIGLLAMTFMIVFIPLSIPVSWAIDTYGFHKAVGFGAILMGIFGITRGLAVLRLSQGGGLRRDPHGHLRYYTRIGRSQLHAGIDQHDRAGCFAAVLAQLMDEGSGAMVRDRGARHRRWVGNAR